MLITLTQCVKNAILEDKLNIFDSVYSLENYLIDKNSFQECKKWHSLDELNLSFLDKIFGWTDKYIKAWIKIMLAQLLIEKFSHVFNSIYDARKYLSEVITDYSNLGYAYTVLGMSYLETSDYTFALS